MIKYKEKKRQRLRDFDYSTNNAYFITFNTKNFVHWFGEVTSGEMVLNEYGKIVENCWYDLPNHYFNCILAEFVIMPNHVHGIIFIDNESGNGSNVLRAFCKKDKKNGFDNDREIKIHGLSEMVRALKSFSSRRINESLQKGLSPICTNPPNEKFQWHRSFYDHIIRDEKSYLNIQNYIINNPKNWEKDRNNNSSP